MAGCSHNEYARGRLGEDWDMGGALPVPIRAPRIRALPCRLACAAAGILGDAYLRWLFIREIRSRAWLGISLFPLRMGGSSDTSGMRNDRTVSVKHQVSHLRRSDSDTWFADHSAVPTESNRACHFCAPSAARSTSATGQQYLLCSSSQRLLRVGHGPI